MAYTTVANVAEYLQTTIDGSSTPTSTTVTEWISEAEAEIDALTKTTYESTTVTEAIIDFSSDSSTTSASEYDATGALNLPPKWDRIALPYKNVLTITNLWFNVEPPQNTPSWVLQTEGLGGHYVLRDDYIQLIDPNNKPYKGVGTIKVSLTYGNTSQAKLVQKLATLMVSERVMSGAQGNSITSSGGGIRVGDIEIDDPTNFSIGFLSNTRKEIDRLMNALGTQNYYLI